MSEPRGAAVIAFYLPQFHPIPENDRFWGPGFTEWTHVTAARGLYPGHHQPKLPGMLGFYDLRSPEARMAQADLARCHGVAAFMYWHYWFAGRRLLELPFREVVESGKPDLPFCLGWANHSWTGVWYGRPKRVLIEQTYPGRADAEAHFEAILPALRDPRYLRIEGRPLFLIFQPMDLPDPKGFCELWRALARRSGLPGLHLVGFGHEPWDPTRYGFDASVLHGPRRSRIEGWRSRLRAPGGPRVYSYRRYVERGFPRVVSPLDYPVVLSNWDNTPRRGRRGFVIKGSTPQLFRRHLRDALASVAHRPPDHRIVFLKSWNEWAEGNYVEPDQRFGAAYLEAIRCEVERARAARAPLRRSTSRPYASARAPGDRRLRPSSNV